MILCLALVLAGCAGSGNSVKPNPVPSIRDKVRVEVLWRQQVGDGLGADYQKLTPAIFRDGIYAADREGKVFAFDKLTGERIWKASIKQAITGGVGVSDESVFVGTPSGHLVALSRLTGEEQWRAQVTSEILAAPQSNGVVVVAQTIDGKVYGFDADTGEQLWFYAESLPALTLRGTATPVLTDEAVVAGFSNGKVIALSSLDGGLFWDQRIARGKGTTELERLIDIDGSPVLAGDRVFASSYQGNVVSMNVRNGQIVWLDPNSSYHEPALIGDRLFVSGDDGSIYAYEARTGKRLWINKQLMLRQLSPPQNFAGFLVVADYQGYVYIIDPEAGIILSQARIDSDGVRSKMISEDKTLYVLGNDGKLAAIFVKLLPP